MKKKLKRRLKSLEAQVDELARTVSRHDGQIYGWGIIHPPARQGKVQTMSINGSGQVSVAAPHEEIIQAMSGPSIDDTVMMLSLVGISVPEETIFGWTFDQRRHANEWAAQQHLMASDNAFNQEEIIPRPDFLDPLTTRTTEDDDGVAREALAAMDAEPGSPGRTTPGLGAPLSEFIDNPYRDSGEPISVSDGGGD